MFVRILQANEVLPALHLVWEVYVSDVAPLQNSEAVAGFGQFIKYENIGPRIGQGEIILFGAWEGQELCGVSGVDRRGNILLLYVKKQWQRRGIGRMMMQAMCQFCAQTLVVTRMLMKVVPSATTAMNHLGMREIAPVQNVGAETYVPMEMMITPAAVKPKKMQKKTIAIIVAGAVLCVTLISLLCVMVYREARRVFSSPSAIEIPYGESDDFGGSSEGDGSGKDVATGIDAISEYEETGLSFEVKEENYQFSPEDMKSTYVNFEINYPQITGLADEKVQDMVNKELENCAMETKTRIYDNPDTEIKERVLREENPILAGCVEYKVTYLTEDYISVVFEDYTYEGNQNAKHVGLRTRNISLKDGTVYEVKDVFNLNDDFIKEWLEIMRDEADTDDLLAEVDMDGLRKALSGEDTKSGTYQPVFFADAEGVEVGFSFRYADDDENDNGFAWVTAPFGFKEVQKYHQNDEFWELVK